MTNKLSWDNSGDKVFESGVDHAVLYPTGGTPAAWNGIVSITETPSGAEPSKQYADNILYSNLIGAEEFGATIEAFTYPDEFLPCDGGVETIPGLVISQQSRATFGLCYRTKVGNDTTQELAYKYHLVYNCLAAPSEKAYTTLNDSPENITFSWEISTTPVSVTGMRPTSLITIDSEEADPTKLAALLVILYGTVSPAVAPRLPLPDEIITLLTP
jgi:hypothetical protein